MRVKDAVGRFGEDLAAAHLEAAGFALLARNWRCRDGEIDIVARDGGTVVFVEVKTRSGLGFGHPAEAVTAAKAARIQRLAMRWLEQNRADGGRRAELRFDVVTVLRSASGGTPELTHLRGAF